MVDGDPARSSKLDRHELEESFRLRLRRSDLDQREAAFDEITAQAMEEPLARAALQAIASDGGDPDLAFTARLALREIDRGGAGRSFTPGNPLRVPGVRGGFTQVDPLEAMQQRMEDMLENDPFMQDFFAGDPFFGRGGSGFFRRGPSLFGSNRGQDLNGAQATDPFEEMRQRVERMRQQFEDLQGGALRPGSSPRGSQPLAPGAVPAPSSVFSSSSSMSIEQTPDGVRVEITEDDGTGPNQRVYEAPTMEALLEANPELKGRVR
ncbi:hypothetical protein Poly30_55190 [Planctomycetes bacterium Poly30]|uniref:Uncharacterized protein n=2 Tax=Saltatorellus ferox TaxID=2528018 RepID=A0A518F0T8_9BACT|nr:hypothetical protein Poly30_55190 [Planctomycetes bacterium Poly30]